MKMPAKGRYGLRFMLVLAARGDTEITPLREIARDEELSEKYLEHIVAVLYREKLIYSVRGARGGYRLSRPPSEITVGEILRAMDGTFRDISCRSDGTHCAREAFCPAIDVWQNIQDALDGVVDRVTLADLVDRRAEKLGTLSVPAR